MTELTETVPPVAKPAKAKAPAKAAKTAPKTTAKEAASTISQLASDILADRILLPTPTPGGPPPVSTLRRPSRPRQRHRGRPLGPPLSTGCGGSGLRTPGTVPPLPASAM